MAYVTCYRVGDEVVVIDKDWSDNTTRRSKYSHIIEKGTIGIVTRNDGEDGNQVRDSWWLRVAIPGETSDIHVQMKNLVLASELGEGDVYVVSYVSDKKKKTWDSRIRATSEQHALHKAEEHMMRMSIDAREIKIRKV